jgi:hypothetical protein
MPGLARGAEPISGLAVTGDVVRNLLQ